MSRRNRVGRYDLGRTLGAGTFGKVKYATNIHTGESVAIKIIDTEHILKHQNMIKREISTMKLIKHPNVVQLFEVLASKKNVYIVMEFVNGGEVFDKIVEKGKLSECDARKYFQQLVHAVDYCHSRGVYHRDLKPENLLLDANGDLKISDFGLSALSLQRWEDGLLHTICGTPNYVAPEVINEKGYDGALVDVWSCGVILYVLLAGFLPFDEANVMTLYRKIDEADFTFPTWFSAGTQQLIKRILDPNPKTRATVPEILDNEWFKIDDSQMECDEKEVSLEDMDPILGDSKGKENRPALINAFELISMSHGLDLSTLFDDGKSNLKKEWRFASNHPAGTIISKIESFASSLGFTVREENYKMKMKSNKAGRKGCLFVETEVSEIGQCLFMVQMKKSNGDTVEFHNFHKEFRIGLKDIIWRSEDEL